MLNAEANANGCYRAGERLTMTQEAIDPETGALLMKLDSPAYILGAGRITELWFAPSMFVHPEGNPAE